MAVRRNARVVTTAVACAVALGLMNGAAPAAHAVDPVPIPSVYTDGLTPDTGQTINQVYGLIPDPSAFEPPFTVEEVKPPRVDPNNPPVLGPDYLAPMANLVTGLVQTVDHAVAANTTVVIELVQQGVADAQVATTEVARTVTDEAGRFLATIPTTDQVLAAAEYGNGVVNLTISAVQTRAEAESYLTYYGAGFFYTSVMQYNAGYTGLATAPVNVGVLLIANTADHATGGLEFSDPTADDPYDPATPAPVERPGVLAVNAPAAEAIADVPWVGYGVETPDVMRNTDLPVPEWPNYPSDTPEENEDPDGGDARCKKIANQKKWFVDEEKMTYGWQPVGEVHGWLGTNVKYKYAEKASTTIGGAIKIEMKPWKISGSTSIANDGGLSNGLDFLSSYQARYVKGEFVHHYIRRTWCPEGYNEGDRGPYATHEAKVWTTKWTGGVNYDYSGKELPGDGWDAYYKARDSGRAMTIFQRQTVEKISGKTYKYSADVEAFGVRLFAVSSHDVKHKMTLKTTERLKDWHAFGDKDVPASAHNGAIYVSG